MWPVPRPKKPKGPWARKGDSRWSHGSLFPRLLGEPGLGCQGSGQDDQRDCRDYFCPRRATPPWTHPTLYKAAGSQGAGAHFAKAGRWGPWTRRAWSPKLEVGIGCGGHSVIVTATSWHICFCSFNTQNTPMKRYCYFILQKKKETANGWHLVTQLVRSKANTQAQIRLALTTSLPCLCL